MAVLYLALGLYWFIQSLFFKPKHDYFSGKATVIKQNNNAQHGRPRNHAKAPWVIEKVIYLTAISGYGAGKVASLFNQRYGHQETVSKTFVYEKLQANRHRLFLVRRDIKSRPPRKLPINHTWGLDLTQITVSGKKRLLLGLVDHGSRLNLRLAELSSKHSATIVLELIKAIRQFDFPKYVRTDNEACFTSCWFRCCLQLLGIKHQRSAVASPWQNGRIERFFGTFKEKIKQIVFLEPAHLQFELDIYRAWYNVIRPHQNLNGLTPAEIFSGKLSRHSDNAVEVSAWDGLLTGYYFPD